MANERIIAELIIQGATKAVADIQSVQNAETSFLLVQESIGVKQRVVYDANAKAAEQAAQRQIDASRRAADAIKRAEEDSVVAINRAAAARAQARRAEAAAAPAQRAQALASIIPRGGDLSSRAAAQQAQVLSQVEQVTNKVTAASNKKTQAISTQSQAEGQAATKGITYLSTLSAIHAASFLATGRTFSLVGSFFTLGAAFSKLGPAGAGAGLAIGGLLAVFNLVTNSIGAVVAAITTAIEALVKFAAIGAVAIAAVGTASVKLAADVETQFALIQAVTGGTADQLRPLLTEVNKISTEFGVAAAQVAEAASLFVRAGGTIEEAINGATRAIIQLQVASAGELTAATAARTVAVGLKAFSAEGVTAEQVANAVAAAAQRSALSFTEVNQAFQQAIPGSVKFGITLSDVTSIVAVLGETLRGTVAGTSFKQFLLDLVDPSEKAKKALAGLGVSVVGLDGKIRPIFDIIGDLTKAIEGLGEKSPEANRALAAIFESRAGLAGGILSSKNVEQLRKVRAELEALTVVKITDVLLLPLNKQAEILINTLKQLGQAIGGPLLQSLRGATANSIDFVKSFGAIATLIGQTLGVLASGQGFGELQQQIQALTGNTQVTSFFVELINVFRNIADVVQQQIIPAIIDFATSIGSLFSDESRLQGGVDVFQSLNSVIQQAGTFIAGLIRAFGVLVVEIVNNTGRGKELRDAFTGIINAIVSLIAAIAALGIGAIPTIVVIATVVGVATAAFIKFGEVVIGVVANSAQLLSELAAAIDAVGTTFDRVGTAAKKAQLGAAAGLAINNQDFEEFKRLQAEIADLDKPIQGPRQNPLAQFTAGLANKAALATETIANLKAGITTANEGIVQSFENLSGTIPDLLSNLRNDIAKAQITPRIGEREGSTGAPPDLVDENALKRAGERVAEAGRDVVRKLENIREDAATRAQEILERASERIGDIFEKADTDLKKLARDTAERIEDINEAVRTRRGDRNLTDTLKKRLDEEVRLEQQKQDAVERIEKRATEDTEREFDRQQSAGERAFARTQQAAEQAFSNIQKAREQALSATQDAEERALKKSLDTEARERTERQELAAAKTPQERVDVQAKQAQARVDRAFDEKQQAQLDALKSRHDAQRLASQQAGEQAQQGFRQSQEDQMLAFREKNEQRAIDFRRKLEDDQLPIRLAREETLRQTREANELQLQALQDKIEDRATARSKERIERERSEREQEITAGALKQVGEVQDSVVLQLGQQANQLDKALRNASQAFEDSFDQFPADVRQHVLPAIDLIRSQIAALQTQIIDDQERTVSNIQAQIEAQTILGAAKIAPPAAQAPAGAAATTVGVLTALSLILPPSFTTDLTASVSEAIRLAWASQAPIVVDVTPVVDAIEDLEQGAFRRR